MAQTLPVPEGKVADSASDVEQRYFDGLIASEGEFNPFTDTGWATLRRAFVEMTNPYDAACLLDVGCGTGQSRQIYDGHFASYVGIDLSNAALERARAKFPGDEWLHADACTTGFPDESFDVVAFSSVLHHIDDFPSALQEAARLLRPGGVAFAFDPNVLNPAMALFRHPKSPLYNSQGVSPNERPLHPVVLRDAFVAAGLTDIRQRAQADLPYRAVAPKLLNSLLFLHNAGDWLLARTSLGHFFGTFVITVGRKPGPPAR